MKRQTRMDNPEKLATRGTQDTGRRQSRETGNTRNTKHRTKTYKTKNTMDNPEKLATRGTRDTGRRHTKQKTQWIIQRNWQHKEHETQDEDIQNKKHNG